MTNNSLMRIIVIVAVVALGAAVFILRPASQADQSEQAVTDQNLPLLIDLGSDKCVNCKRMKAILDGMKEEQSQYFSVQFIDVWKNPKESEAYKINLIPTQVFLSAKGEELFRHEGFFSREEILSKWNELGVPTGSL